MSTINKNIFVDLGTSSRVLLDPQTDLTDYIIYAQFSKYYNSQKTFSFTVSVESNVIYLSYTGDIESGRYVYDVFGVNTSTLEVVKLFAGDVNFVPNVTTIPVPIPT